jgi:Rrf2 family transcriptional regulator, iron-sulfur cluster assembly transcription factor
MLRRGFFAFEAVLYIACKSSDKAVSLKEICANIGVSERYLEQTMQRLVHAGILRGVRGPKGGYLLAREKRKINLQEIFSVIDFYDGSIEKSSSSELKEKVIKPLNFSFNSMINEHLKQITVNDLYEQAKGAGILEKIQQKADNFNI